MLKTFDEVVAKARELGKVVISVAAAQDREVLGAIKAVAEAGLAGAILVGDAAPIRAIMAEVGLPADMQVIHEPEPRQAALKAASLVRQGQAQVLMKGLVNSGDFLKAVLNPEMGLRSGRLLSHFAAFEAPDGDKLIYHSDGGMNIAPNLEEKKEILANSLAALLALGIQKPKVAVLAANEVVNPKMPVTVDAQALAALHAAGERFAGSIIEGPISMDVALNPKAAQHKGISSSVAGDVDLFLLPSIEAGNLLAKALIHYAKFKNAGVVVGATHPVVMVSRADSAEAKIHSIALACLLAAGAEQRKKGA
ncbi:MAG TPA: phosphate acyltransferase [Patescibacteria group bacterium]|nr:phosphate acyltransferase [Patescibacteria group bacterium]